VNRDVILINPAPLQSSARQDGAREWYPYPPLGLLVIAGQLMMHQYRPVVIDFFRKDFSTRDAFTARLRAASPAPLAIGISTYTETIHDAAKIARACRGLYPGVPIIMGGPHATFCAAEILRDNPAVDFVVRNEGEGSIIELLEHLRWGPAYPVEKIPGLTFRTSAGEVTATADRGFVTHLDCLPLPPVDLIPTPRSATGDKLFILMTSRGCPAHCVFCASRAMSGGAYRMHSAEWLVSQVHFRLQETGFASMGVMDDTFLVNRVRLRAFLGYLRQLKIRRPWTCKSRVDTISDGTLALLKEHNCKSIHIGVESADDRVLASIDKNITLAKIMNAIYLLKKHGIRPECSFILGHHSDTRESMEKTVLLARWIRDEGLGISIIGICTPLPGTPLLQKAAELGVRILHGDWLHYDLNTPIFQTPNFTVEDVKRAQYHFDVESRAGVAPPTVFGSDIDPFRRFLADWRDRIAGLEVEREVSLAHGT